MEIWNKAAVAKHIWFLVSGGEQSMWCQWVKSYLLKGKSFWSVKTPSNPSWVWRKILNLRPLIQPYIKYKIGDGQLTSLWFDNWHPLGPLLQKFGSRIVCDSGLLKDATVKDIIMNNQWAFLMTQTPDLNDVKSELQSVPINDSIGDRCIWTLTASGKFNISSLWENLRTQYPAITWCKVIWFSGHIPRCSVISWLAILNRLSTEDRLVSFAMKSSSICSLCLGVESRDHLFFDCPMATQIRGILSPKTPHMAGLTSWQQWVSRLSTLQGKSLAITITKLVFTVYVHQLWIERNYRKFQNISCPPGVVANKISNIVRCRLLSLSKFKGPSLLLSLWNIHD